MEPLTAHLVLAPAASIDLQLHTTCSDGVWTPEELVDYLVHEQFDLVAVTDHDRPDSVASIQQLAAQKNLPVLAAAEMSTSWQGNMLDVLCYGFDPEKNELNNLAQDVLRRQQENTREVYENLRRKGYPFSHQQEIVKEQGGEPQEPHELMAILEKPGSQHPHELIALLEKHGYRTGETSLGDLITDAGFFFATTGIAAVVDAAHRSGDVCLIAHPGRGGEFPDFDPPLLDQLRSEVPLDGLEVYHPDHSPHQVEMYLNYAQTHQLLQSTGSDSHGRPGQMPIKYRAEISRRLLERVGIHVR